MTNPFFPTHRKKFAVGHISQKTVLGKFAKILPGPRKLANSIPKATAFLLLAVVAVGCVSQGNFPLARVEMKAKKSGPESWILEWRFTNQHSRSVWIPVATDPQLEWDNMVHPLDFVTPRGELIFVVGRFSLRMGGHVFVVDGGMQLVGSVQRKGDEETTCQFEGPFGVPMVADRAYLLFVIPPSQKA